MTAVLSYFFPNIYGKDPNNFINFQNTIDSKSEVCDKYHLLRVLDNKYNFIHNNEIYLLFEFELFRKLITSLPNHNISDYEYYRYIEKFNSISEETKNEARYKLTINFICDIFKSYCTGNKVYSTHYIKNCLSLCVSFGKKGLNKRIRRDIYNTLNHEAIINSKIQYGPIQAAMLKVYCRFMTLSGKTPDTTLLESIKNLNFAEKPNTKTEDNTKYNKGVRLFNNVIMDRTADFRECNKTDEKSETESADVESTYIPVKNYNYYILYNNHLAKTKNGSVYNIVNLEIFKEENRNEIINKLNRNMDSLVVKTIYINNDPTFEMVIFDIKGQNYLKRWWNSRTNRYNVELMEIVE
jgi:hypothetical protein